MANNINTFSVDKKVWLTPSRVLPFIFFGILLLLPTVVTGYYLHSLILILMYAVLGTAWNWLGGFAGQISLAHAVFFGLGAYACGCSQVWWDWNPWLGTIFAMVLVGVLSGLIGLPCFRLKGHYFAIATIAVGEIVKVIFINWQAVGGAVGLYLPIRETSLANFQFDSKIPYYYIILIMLIISTLITIWLKNSRNGYYFRAIKEDPEASKALGINLVKTKLLAMVLSGTICAMVGSFYVNYILYTDPESAFLFMTSVQIALIVVMGGMGTVWGPIIGSIIIISLSEGSRIFLGGMGAGIDFVIYGLLIMLIAVYQPGGIVGAIDNAIKKRKIRAKKGAVREVSQ
jgi:branched-chain amino acid transport system permease protein